MKVPATRFPGTLILALLMGAFLFLAGCSEPVTRNSVEGIPVAEATAEPEVSRNASPRILAMGDSLMAWHTVSGRSIANAVGDALNEPVANHSVSGARIIYSLPVSGAMGMRISNQYRKGDWDWVVLNGGGNDLWMGCGCGACDNRMDRMISKDGRKGAIPHLVDSLRGTGAKIVYVGYLRSPGAWSPIEGCKAAGNELENRIAKLAKILPEMHFVSLQDLVPHGDRSYHGMDMIHPSVKASREIGQRVATVIKEVEAGS
ncbi:lysophospholipase L1-like esterase [Shimia isoporae]|uniref:Lysophospholipase L1-like esterase n=1 Tax=Shimia isoporae TaxID=647720 RepID=A0A4V2Q267_9RHOB|nr:SGNH/GDSL hydrolase family protein [Shimia isoporae]TCL01301.1 lysophospholipase L1-like esterase [Shimia isoporae]